MRLSCLSCNNICQKDQKNHAIILINDAQTNQQINYLLSGLPIEPIPISG
jgi:hypothetical protein